MGKAAYDAKLAAIDELKSAEPGPQRDAALKKALADRNNYVAAKAARVAGETSSRELIPDLAKAFDRFAAGGAKSDPQCWAKIAIVKSLAALGHDDPDLYLRGMQCVQMESVWGGRQDTAGPLRSASAESLMDCRAITDLDALEALIGLLHDPDKTVRTTAARAIGRFDRREAALILRVRALPATRNPNPSAQFLPVCSRLKESAQSGSSRAIWTAKAIPRRKPRSRWRKRTNRPRSNAFAPLERAEEPASRAALMAAIALTRLPEAIDFLIERARAGSQEAVKALAIIPLSEEQQNRLHEAVEKSN
jgi:HEAT repeat protein